MNYSLPTGNNLLEESLELSTGTQQMKGQVVVQFFYAGGRSVNILSSYLHGHAVGPLLRLSFPHDLAVISTIYAGAAFAAELSRLPRSD